MCDLPFFIQKINLLTCSSLLSRAIIWFLGNKKEKNYILINLSLVLLASLAIYTRKTSLLIT